MAAVEIIPEDLTPFASIDVAKAQAMIDDAMARASLVAPCIMDEAFAKAAAAKAIIRGAILRWNDAGSGAYSTEMTGPFMTGIDTRQTRKGMFLPSELDELKSLCSVGGGKAFSVDTVSVASGHVPWCSLMMGATYCSCGVDIAGEPIFETGP